MSIFEHTPECRCGPQKSRREQRRPVASLALLSSFISLVSKVQWLFVLDPNVTPLLAVQCKSQVGKKWLWRPHEKSSWSLSKNWISSLLLRLSRQMFCKKFLDHKVVQEFVTYNARDLCSSSMLVKWSKTPGLFEFFANFLTKKN